MNDIVRKFLPTSLRNTSEKLDADMVTCLLRRMKNFGTQEEPGSCGCERPNDLDLTQVIEAAVAQMHRKFENVMNLP